MISTAAKVLAVSYFAGAAVLCYLTKVDHKKFAASDFCSNETQLLQAGRFGPQHCLEHLNQWESLSSWKDEYLNTVLPSVPAEIAFAVAIAIVSVSKWLDVVIIIAGAVTCLAILRRASTPTKKTL